ncbi:MAG: sugar phosphate isomerase/epimerase family protein [Canibacter sp.]
MSEMRIAAAPISWGICDAPDYGYQYPYPEVLDDMKDLGVTASELGPVGFFLPDNAAQAREELVSRGIEPVGLYVDPVMHTDDPAWRDQLERTITFVKDAGATTIVLAALPAPFAYTGHSGLSEAEWKTLLSNLDEASDLAEAAGITLAIHPHLGTLVLTPSEIDRVLEGSKIKFCLDTGHGLAGGNDVVELIRKTGDRLVMVHMKDAKKSLFEQMERGEIEFMTAVEQGIFCSLGEGDLPIDDIFDALNDIDYRGWIVLEQDAKYPAGRPSVSPTDAVAQSLQVVKDQLARIA